MKRILQLSLLLFLPFLAGAQSADLPLNHEGYHFIDRLDIKGLTGNTVHTDLKPYGREQIAQIFADTDLDSLSPKEREWFERQRILTDDTYAKDQETKGFLKYFWTNGRDLYDYNNDKFELYVNPVIYFSGGADFHNYTDTVNTERVINFYNGRGLQFRGSLFNKVGFFTEVIETQYKAPQFVRNRFDERDALEGAGFVKTYDQNTNEGYDFLQARGYITYSPFEKMRLKFGKDRMFWGNGYQSTHLSDNATDYFFLNINTRIWKFEYVNHFTQMVDYLPNKPDAFGTQPKKYAVFHQLNYKPNSKVSVGIFESVVYSPIQPKGERGFELEYMNPIIFYRSVEQYIGSPDNSMLGLNWKINFLNHFQTYGQVMVDDFNWGKFREDRGYWGTKTGVQLGAKYIDVANVSGLDLQAEFNRIRPFTYSHFNPSANYSHYGTELAHPMGANFSEFIGIARYQVTPQLNLQGNLTYLLKGLDPAGRNFGADPFRTYIDRSQDFSNEVGQGDRLLITSVYGKISYQILKLDAFAEIEGRFRKENDFTSLTGMASLRWNIPNRAVKY